MSGVLPPETDVNGNIGPNALAADLVTRVCAWVAVALRFYARRRGGSKYSIDDWLILAAGISVIPTTPVEILWVVSYHLGRHLDWILVNTPQVLAPFAKIDYAEQNVYPIQITLIKSSILFLYIRIFGISRPFTLFCYAQMAMVFVWAICVQFLFLFQCTPAWVAWDTTRSGGTCLDFTRLFVGTNTINVVIDMVIFATPLLPIWKLRLSVRRKILISSALVLGAGELAFSLIRLVILSQLTFEDLTYDVATTVQWSTVEVNVGILCACLPVMAPLLPAKWRGGTSGSTAKNSHNLHYAEPTATNRSSRHYKKFLADSSSVSGQEEHELVHPVPVVGGIQRTTQVNVHIEDGYPVGLTEKHSHDDYSQGTAL